MGVGVAGMNITVILGGFAAAVMDGNVATQLIIAFIMLFSLFITVILHISSMKQTERHVKENNRMEAKYRSARLLSDMLKTTKEFRDGIDHLMEGRKLTPDDHDDLARFLTYLTLLAMCRKDGLVDNEHVGVIIGPILERLPDEEMEKVLGYPPGEFKRDPALYSGVREMRKLLTGV